MARTALLAASTLYLLSVLVAAGALPAEVPLHFGLDGRADRYGPRSEALIGFAAVGLGLLAAWLLVLWGVRRGSLALVDVPHPEYWKTPEREPELRRRLEADLTWFVAATFALLAALPVSTALAADGSGRLPWAFPVLFAVYLVGSLVWCVDLTVRRYRPAGQLSGRSSRYRAV